MEISDRDIAIVATLTNPDEPQQDQYRHDFRISQKILGLLIADRYFLVQSMDLIKPEYFEDEGHRLICSVVFSFFKEYKALPSKVFIENEIQEKRKESQHLYQYLGELEAILADYVPGMENREYLMDKIVEFAKEQAARCAVARTLDVLKKKPIGAWNQIWDVWRNALTTDKGHDLGLDYIATLEERYERMMKEKDLKEIFSSGFPATPISNGIDGLLTSGGLCRGEVGVYVGLSGSGKSIGLINATAQNLVHGKRALYITLEMNQDKIAKRFDALLAEEPFLTLADNKEIVWEKIRSYFHNDLDKRRLIIKHYPGGTVDINTFRALLSQLNLYGFKPDLLVVDYMGEMKDIPNMSAWESRQLLIRDLRTLAIEENICALTAMQANRRGREIQDLEGSIDDDALADSFGQSRPVDAMWSINKIEGSNIGWIYVMKHRDGISKQRIFYEMDTNILKFREIGKEEFNNKRSEYLKGKANEASEKVVAKPFKGTKNVEN